MPIADTLAKLVGTELRARGDPRGANGSGSLGNFGGVRFNSYYLDVQTSS